MMKWIIQLCIGVSFIHAVHCAPGSGTGGTKPSYSRSLETSLRNELFTLGSYSELQRPQERMSVKVSLTVLTVNDLDIKNQVMSVSGYLSLSWFDERLSWDNTSATTQDYTNIRFLFSTETYVWRPAIIIENSVQDISVISDKNIPMRIMSNGYITWNPAGIYLVACSCDITYYPLDEQTCTIKVSTWGYTSNEISLEFDIPAVDMSFYSENGEWLLTDAAGEKSREMSRGGQTFSSLTFSVTLKRRPMFHALNTMVPVALMAFLIPMVFKLPVDSGEKIGYSLTVLLAYAVYLTLISDNIPSTSVSVCYLTVYLVIVLALGVLSVVFVILVIATRHKGDENVSACLARIGRFMAMVSCAGSCCKKGNSDSVTAIGEPNKLPPKIGKSVVGFEDDDKELQTSMTHEDFSKILDRFLFVSYILTVILTTVIFAVMIFSNQ
ncbi:neuronal acetylcholine receptor subunit alpha-2-like [Saccostrea cucullata]|uniref:neuronal acetylcholine receptor subunit alpha-2-like n=1 Tax=Saccostrea cuccullata TaxID=36930 RepID=UPI002ED1042C